MAYVALTSLMSTLELEFLQPIPRLSLHHHHQPPGIKSFFQNLSSLLEFLDIFQFRSAPRDLEIKIRDFALEAEDNIEIQLSNFLLLSKHTAHLEEASQELCRTLQEAAQKAAELLNITNKEKDGETERKMTCDALTSLIWNIQYYFMSKFTSELHDPALIESLLENLSSLQEFVETSNFHDAAIKKFATKIRDFALKAVDGMDIRKEIRVAKASPKLQQTLQRVAENTAELLNTYSISNDHDDEANQTQPPIPCLKHNASQPVCVKGDGSLRCSPTFEGTMVGRQNDVTTIKDQLFSHFGGLKLIPIIGMPGIGKTTLARTIFEDELVSQHFELKIWFTMKPKYNEIQLQRDLLWSITLAEQHEIKEGRTLTEMVQECLMYKRYLVVLDDIWSTKHWEYIQNCFPSYVEGSCILLTTRFYGVSEYICSFKGNYPVMSLLDSNESWDLFSNIFPLQKYIAPRFEKFRSHLSHVVNKCDGLPQTIVKVAERLSECKHNIQHELTKIEKQMELLGILDYSSLTLIYNRLPEYLKVCFLYLGIFPKRSEIQVKMLLRLWIAEGFVKPSQNKELEEIAYCYLKALINTSLVLIGSRTYDGKIKTCRVHSVMHNICFREAQKEGILCAVNTQQLPKWSLNAVANSCRWLSLYKHSFDYYVVFSTNKPRSIFFFQDNSEIFVPFKLLRVLALFVPSPLLQRVPMHLGDLVFLRYLFVTQWFEGLNDVVSTNMSLQTLVVSRSDSESQLGIPTLRLPSTIWKLPQLRHLDIGTSYTIDPPSMVNENLQTLSWVAPTHCRKKVYSNFRNIQKLKVFYKGDSEPNHISGSSSNPIILDNFGHLNQLQKLTIFVSSSTVIHTKQFMCPLQLKKLRLSGTNLSQRNLNVISKLWTLKVLKLENAIRGKVWEVAKGGFNRVEFLLLKDETLEQLRFDTFTFQGLKHLVLRFCNRLEELPNQLYCLEVIRDNWFTYPLLKSIELDRCNPLVVASAKRIREELWNYQNKSFELILDGAEYEKRQSYTYEEEDEEEPIQPYYFNK